MLAQAYITRYPPHKSLPGLFFCSSFRYDLSEPPSAGPKLYGGEAGSAQIQAMNANVQIFRQFAQEFFPGLEGNYTVTNILESPVGAFRLWAGWTLSSC
jgi:hypothetical protein